MRKMKVKLMLIFVIALMLMLCANCVAYASEIQKGEFSQKYQEWMKLSDEEKKTTIPPLPINIRGNINSSVTSTSQIKSFKGLRSLLSNNPELIDRYDLRDYIDIEVKDQMSASQCWAFSANSSLETFLAIRNKEYNFSERHIDYETSLTFIEGPTEMSLKREIKDGGYMGTAFTYFSRGSGPILEEDMPFKNHENPISQSDLPKERTIQKVDNMIYFPQIYKNNEGEYFDSDGIAYSDEAVNQMRNEIKKHIKNNGGITVSIYSPNDERYYNKETYGAYMNNPILKADHAVTIIGWDDTYSKENFVVQPSKDGAYIALNSYGSEFGENGVYYISYEDFLVETQMRGFTSVSDIEYDNLYQYDTSEMYNYINSQYAANVFTSKDDEKLTEVMIGSMSQQFGDLYVNNSDDVLNINNAIKVASNVELKPGYTTVKIDNNIELQKGKNFAIIVKLDENYMGIGIEDSTSYFARVTSNPGESYISNDGANWNDIYDEENEMNLSIKAYTQVEEARGKITDVKYSTKQIIEGIGGNAIVYLKTTTSYEGENVDVSIYNNENADVTSQFSLTVPKVENTMSKILIQVPQDTQVGVYNVKITINSKEIANAEIEVKNSEIFDDEFIKIHFPDLNLYEALKEKNVMPSENVLAYYDDTQEMILKKNIKSLDLEGTFERWDGFVTFGSGYNIEDLTGLDKLTNLEYLNLNNNKISNLSPLANLTNLGALELYNNRGEIENLNDLSNLTKLYNLQITSSKVKDISAVSNLTKLDILDVQNNEITDISPLANCTNLNRLYLNSNPISDISPLANLTAMDKLSIQVANLTDISALANLTDLRELNLNVNKIEDISPLRNLKKLEKLSLPGNPISDISALANLTNLTRLDFRVCNITDISVLSNLTNLRELNLSANKVEDISILNDLENFQIGVFWDQMVETTINNINQNIEIPKLFQDSFNSSSLVYSEDGAELIGCSWVEEGKTIRVNSNCTEATIRILGGTACDSIFKVIVDDGSLKVTSIEISTQPRKVEYKKGEELDLIGGKLLVKYEDDTEEELNLTDENITISNYDKNLLGEQTIDITYKGCMTQLIITVKDNDEILEKEITSISIKTQPDKLEYILGEDLDLTGGELLVEYNNETEEVIPLTDENISIVNNDSNIIGEQTISIFYKNFGTYIIINVSEEEAEKEISSIQVSTEPNKIEYKKGEELDLTGGKLLVKYKDETEEEIDLTAEGITISNYYPDSIGKQAIYIQYKGQMTGLWITIVENQENPSDVRIISVAEEPYNKEFFKGDELLFNGGKIFVIYMDDSKDIIPFSNEEITFSNYDPEQLGEQTITINYKGATTGLIINVIEKQTEDNYWQFLPYLIARDSENGYLENIEQGTTCKDIIDVAYTNGRIEIYKDDKLVEDLNEKLATGMIVKVIFTNEEYSYKIVVTGDINGDAEVDELDLLMLARYNAGYEKETQMVVNEYLRAANVHKDDDFGDVLDLLKLARMLVNLD